MSRRIYMDYQATTPVDPRALEAMLPYFTERFGNPSSGQHEYGWEAAEAVEQARASLAGLIHARPREVVFTSGATESNNLAIKGAFFKNRDRGRHIVTTAIEHRAVLDVVKRLESHGADVTIVGVDRRGLVDPKAIEAALRDDTILVSVMAANNEIGTLQPLEQIGAVTRERGILLHTDAAQAVGKVPVDVDAMNIDLLALSAHKLYGPKGVGALFVRRRHPRVLLECQLDGGGQERGLRSGTLPVPLIVGLGRAAELASAELSTEMTRLSALRQRLLQRLMAELDHVELNGDLEQRLPGNLNLSFAYVEGQSLLMALRGVAVSSSSACQSQNAEPSHVLQALGVSGDLAHTSLRFGLGRFTTEAEVDEVADRVVEAVARLRKLSPLYQPARQE